MGITKTNSYEESQMRMATIAKALGHPARIAIVEYLVKVNTCICGDIVGELSLAQPTISQHLKELKMAGIIKGTIEGNSICYCLDGNVWKEWLAYVQAISDSILNRQINCCN